MHFVRVGRVDRLLSLKRIETSKLVVKSNVYKSPNAGLWIFNTIWVSVIYYFWACLKEYSVSFTYFAAARRVSYFISYSEY